MRIIKPYLNNIIFGYFGAYKVYPFSASGGVCQSDLICAVLIKQLAVKVYIHCDMVEKKVKIRTLVKFPSEAAFQYNTAVICGNIRILGQRVPRCPIVKAVFAYKMCVGFNL